MDRTTRYVEPPTPPTSDIGLHICASYPCTHIRIRTFIVRSQALVHNVASFDNLQGGWCRYGITYADPQRNEALYQMHNNAITTLNCYKP
ncbi:hypothetical protein M0802_000388 [Mischocyttarus mexicanus]|nr:hypothetical protein M0802_000388 [Mischocyttarus mexicanus]